LILGASSADKTVTFANPIALNAGTRTVQVDKGSAAVDAILSGAVTGGTGSDVLNKTGAGTLQLSNTGNNYAGGTTLTAGTLQLGAAGVIPDSGTFTFAGGTLDQNSFTETIGPLTLNVSGGGTSTIILNADGTQQNITFSGTTTYTAGKLLLSKYTTTSGDLVLLTSQPTQDFLNNVQFLVGSTTINGAYWRGDLGGALVPVPEPVNVALGAFGAGAVGVGIARRLMRRSKEAAAAASSRQG